MSTAAPAKTRFKNHIAGKWVETGSNGTFDNINPADTSDVVGEFPQQARKSWMRRSRLPKMRTNSGAWCQHHDAERLSVALVISWHQRKKNLLS